MITKKNNEYIELKIETSEENDRDNITIAKQNIKKKFGNLIVLFSSKNGVPIIAVGSECKKILICRVFLRNHNDN